jgi:hypothetical protein
MSDVAVIGRHVPAMSDAAIDKVRQLEKVALTKPQIDIATDHVLHAGVYSRTILIPTGSLLTGALIKVATTLIVCGDVDVYVGGAKKHVTGYKVLAASAKRKQAFFAHSDTYLTMIFATQSLTIAESENEFTDEADLLFSRRKGALNTTTITKE